MSIQKTEAIHAFAKALRLNPNIPEVWTELAQEYESHGLVNDAVRCAEKAYELKKDDKTQHYLQSLKDRMFMENGSISSMSESGVYNASSFKIIPEDQEPNMYLQSFHSSIGISPFGDMHQIEGRENDFANLSVV